MTSQTIVFLSPRCRIAKARRARTVRHANCARCAATVRLVSVPSCFSSSGRSRIASSESPLDAPPFRTRAADRLPRSWMARATRSRLAKTVDVRDPGPLFAAAAAGGTVIVEDAWDPSPGPMIWCSRIGTLDTVNELPLALRLIRRSMREDGALLGAVPGGDTLPQLRAAMRAADALWACAAPHVHPRIEASALAPLLGGGICQSGRRH